MLVELFYGYHLHIIIKCDDNEADISTIGNNNRRYGISFIRAFNGRIMLHYTFCVQNKKGPKLRLFQNKRQCKSSFYLYLLISKSLFHLQSNLILWIVRAHSPGRCKSGLVSCILISSGTSPLSEVMIVPSRTFVSILCLLFTFIDSFSFRTYRACPLPCLYFRLSAYLLYICFPT